MKLILRSILKWLLDQADVAFSHDDGVITIKIDFAGIEVLHWTYTVPLKKK